MDEKGWIPPEQARGDEAVQNIPYEYQPILENESVPPSFLMPL